MPDITSQVISNTALRAKTQILELINNILSAFQEVDKQRIENELSEFFDQMAMNQVPWDQQLIKVANRIARNPDIPPEAVEQIMQIFEKSSRTQKENSVKYDELERTVRKSRLPVTEKRILLAEITKAKQECTAPHGMVVDNVSLTQITKLLKQQKLMDQVSAIRQVSGDYLLIYNAGIEKQMEEIVDLAGLALGRLPRPEVSDLRQYLSCVVDPNQPDQGQLIKFTGLSLELAEKAVLESTKSRTFSFAKEQNANGTYDLICFGGVSEQDKQRFYKEALQTLTYAAFTLTGETGQCEQKRARYLSEQYDNIRKVLEAVENSTIEPEDQGYVFSIHAITDSNNNRFILTDDFIQFDENSFVINYNGTQQIVKESECEDYTRTLRLNLQSGIGQKVYISNKQMEALMQKAVQAEDLINSLDSTNKLDQLAELINKHDEITKKIADAKISKMPTGDLYKEMAIINIARDTIARNMKAPEFTFDMYKEAAIGFELKTYEPQHIQAQLSKEQVENANITNQAMRTFLEQTDLFDNINPDMVNSQDITRILNYAAPTEFLQQEMQRAEPVYDGQDPSIFNTDDYIHEAQICERDFDMRCQSAFNMLMPVQVEIEPAEIDVKDRNTKATRGRYNALMTGFQKLLNEIETRAHEPEYTQDSYEPTHTYEQSYTDDYKDRTNENVL